MVYNYLITLVYDSHQTKTKFGLPCNKVVKHELHSQRILGLGLGSWLGLGLGLGLGLRMLCFSS